VISLPYSSLYLNAPMGAAVFSISTYTAFLRHSRAGRVTCCHMLHGATSVLLEAIDRRPLPPPSAGCRGWVWLAGGHQEHEPDKGIRHTLCTRSSSPLMQPIADIRLPLACPRAPQHRGRRSISHGMAPSGDRGRSSHRPCHHSLCPNKKRNPCASSCRASKRAGIAWYTAR
jgi:hypothetical protein